MSIKKGGSGLTNEFWDKWANAKGEIERIKTITGLLCENDILKIAESDLDFRIKIYSIACLINAYFEDCFKYALDSDIE